MAKFIHIRLHNEDGSIASKGGETIAYRELCTGWVDIGVAQCHKDKDVFNKKMGRTVAEGRLNKHPTMIRRMPDESPLQAILRHLYGAN
jgi:hypothetical protein